MRFSNNEITDGLITGDRAVLQYLYEKTGPTIIGFVINNSGTEEEGRDYFRIALMTARENLKNKKYKEGNKIEAYIGGIARNKWLEELKKQKKKKERETTLTDKENWVKDQGRTAEEKIIKEEEVKLLHRCLKMLSEMCQELLRMHYFGGIALKEISETQEIKEGTTRKQHFACKKKLKTLLLAANMR